MYGVFPIFVEMTKAEIRKISSLQRKSLSNDQIHTFSERLLALFSSFDLSLVKTIHVFLPMASKNEPDTFLFIDWLQLNFPQIRILIPKADFITSLMTNHLYKGRKELIESNYGILEPEVGEVYTGVVDMVLVPLLAFDLQGYRVGYGKGFYDRFLQGLEVTKIGLSFFEPVERIDDVDPYDVKLDCCITPEKIYQFQG